MQEGRILTTTEINRDLLRPILDSPRWFWPVIAVLGLIVLAAAIVVGMVSSLSWILLSGDTYSAVYGLPAEQAIVPFSQPGIITIPLGFIVLIVVSLFTQRTGTAEAIAKNGSPST